MKSIIIGAVILAAAVFAALPGGLGWANDILAFLRGAAPVVAVLIGLIALLIGIADIKDRAEARKEARKQEKAGE